jgi:hypothetical protein
VCTVEAEVEVVVAAGTVGCGQVAVASKSKRNIKKNPPPPPHRYLPSFLSFQRWRQPVALTHGLPN